MLKKRFAQICLEFIFGQLVIPYIYLYIYISTKFCPRGQVAAWVLILKAIVKGIADT